MKTRLVSALLLTALALPGCSRFTSAYAPPVPAVDVGRIAGDFPDRPAPVLDQQTEVVIDDSSDAGWQPYEGVRPGDVTREALPAPSTDTVADPPAETGDIGGIGPKDPPADLEARRNPRVYTSRVARRDRAATTSGTAVPKPLGARDGGSGLNGPT
jgi:hypothetical protein